MKPYCTPPPHPPVMLQTEAILAQNGPLTNTWTDHEELTVVTLSLTFCLSMSHWN